MSGPLTHALQQRLRPAAARLVSRLPRAWRATARRRRILCLAGCAPGFSVVALLPLHRNLWALLGGTLAVIAAAALRTLSEPGLAAGERHD